ncbi:hypothetical protein BC629DRAFT_1037749 [Irpex lacteus]|nr:hypothetical protein BC629DRAFT_1037749 [Irpex lacteus]
MIVLQMVLLFGLFIPCYNMKDSELPRYMIQPDSSIPIFLCVFDSFTMAQTGSAHASRGRCEYDTCQRQVHRRPQSRFYESASMINAHWLPVITQHFLPGMGALCSWSLLHRRKRFSALLRRGRRARERVVFCLVEAEDIVSFSAGCGAHSTGGTEGVC